MTRTAFPGVSRDTRKVIAAAVKRGWEATLTGRGHIRLTHPAGGIVICSGTTANRDAHRHLEADLRRVERSHDA